MTHLKNYALAFAVLALCLFAPFGPMAQAADLSVTPGSVVAGTNATTMDVTAGATLTAGQPVYLDSTANNKAKACLATSSAAAKMVGIALHGASSGQPLKIIVGGTVTIGATTTVGQVYVVSANAGGIAPVSDLISTNYVTIIGIADTSTTIQIKLQVSGVAKP